MIPDKGLRLAAAEAVNTVNGGAAPGGLGPASVTLNLDPSGQTLLHRTFANIGGGERLLLNFNVDTAFTCGTFGATLEFRLVSLPINASLLTNATTAGKQLLIDDLPIVAATDSFTLANHGLPVGAPVFLSQITTTTGISTNTIYYTVPITSGAFGLATSLANAIAGTLITLTTNGSADVNFIPTCHASSGTLPLYNVGDPTNQGPLRLRTQFQLPIRPLATRTPKSQIPGGQVQTSPLGAGSTDGLIAANAQRYYYLHYIPSHTITAGAVTCDIVLDAGDSLQFYPNAYEVIG